MELVPYREFAKVGNGEIGYWKFSEYSFESASYRYLWPARCCNNHVNIVFSSGICWKFDF